MTNKTILATLGTLALCAATFSTLAQAQVSIGYAPIAPPAQDGGYAANARPFSVASAYDGPPAAAGAKWGDPAPRVTAPSVTAPVIETLYRPTTYQTAGYQTASYQPTGVPTPVYSQPSATVQTASYLPATSAYYRPAVNTAAQPVSYVQPVRTAYPTSYVPAGQVQPVNYVQPVNNLQPVAGTQPILQPTPANVYYGAQPVAATSFNPCTCGPTMTYAPASPAYAAPAVAPGYAVPARDYAYSPVIALRPMPSDYTVGQGLLGQPKVYVEGEPIRNFFRYILP